MSLEIITEHEGLVRLSAFASIFIFMALLEIFLPRRKLTTAKSKRWLTNFLIFVLDIVFVRIFMPILPIGIALWSNALKIGLLNWFDISKGWKILIAILVLDVVIYFQHRFFHRLPFFWRFHKVHHTDLDFDVTTGFRFHPVEIIFSLLIKIATVIIVGAPAEAVVLFEIILNGTSLFNHGNVHLPKKLDHYLRKVIVTPDMHRVHHSVIPTETDSNFCFNISLWDHLFGTYTAQPKKGHKGMSIGLNAYQAPEKVSLGRILILPFAK